MVWEWPDLDMEGCPWLMFSTLSIQRVKTTNNDAKTTNRDANMTKNDAKATNNDPTTTNNDEKLPITTQNEQYRCKNDRVLLYDLLDVLDLVHELHACHPPDVLELPDRLDHTQQHTKLPPPFVIFRHIDPPFLQSSESRPPPFFK